MPRRAPTCRMCRPSPPTHFCARSIPGSLLPVLPQWIVDPLDDRNAQYAEFWRFASELGDTSLLDPKAARRDAWTAVMRPLYESSVTDDGPTAADRAQSIRSTEFIYRSWNRME